MGACPEAGERHQRSRRHPALLVQLVVENRQGGRSGVAPVPDVGRHGRLVHSEPLAGTVEDALQAMERGFSVLSCGNAETFLLKSVQQHVRALQR